MQDDILKKIKVVLDKHIADKSFKFFLYWSRAKWDYFFRSDYDIWVLWPKPLSSTTKLEIQDDFENIPALIDFTDFSQVSPEFKKQAMKDVIYLN